MKLVSILDETDEKDIKIHKGYSTTKHKFYNKNNNESEVESESYIASFSLWDQWVNILYGLKYVHEHIILTLFF